MYEGKGQPEGGGIEWGVGAGLFGNGSATMEDCSVPMATMRGWRRRRRGGRGHYGTMRRSRRKGSTGEMGWDEMG